jgi:hypothetical protein
MMWSDGETNPRPQVPDLQPSQEPLASPVLSKTDSRKNLDDPRWHLVQRIVISRSMGRSPLLSEFLLYICDRHLRNQAAEMTEQRIGVHVFGRSECYNSNDDNIVRNYARTLRKRVDDYFATEDKHEDLRLEIPRGAYVPVFYSRPPEATSDPWSMDKSSTDKSAAPSLIEETRREQPALSPQGSSPHLFVYPLVVLCSILAAVIVIYCALHGFPRAWRAAAAPTSQPISPSDALWAQLFQKERDTFVVPADSGLVIMQGLTGQPVSLGDYVSGKYQSDGTAHARISAGDVRELGTRRYTSIVDLNLVLHLSRLKQVVPLSNLDGSGHVLLVGGLNMAGTQAAGEFVLNPALMGPTLDHARVPHGSLRPFEILIETSNVAANASSPHVVSERVGPL